jgi:putative nucleotidyltransferase with HDIG domain
MELLLPELARCRGIEQKGFHKFDVLDHSLLAADFAARKGFSRETRLAALFHDIGKVETRKYDNGVWTFYRHEAHSARIAKAILLRLRFPGAVTEKACHLIAEHMFHYTEDWSDAAVRRFIIRAGEENLEDLYALRRADSFATAGAEPPPEALASLAARVDAELAKRNALSLKSLAVNGGDLVALGAAPGKRLGAILGELLEAAIEDPALNTREKMLEIAENLLRRGAPNP